jgi:hypothetical protein
VPFLPGLPKDCVQISDEPGSAEFVQDEPPERLELVFRERGLCDQQHAVEARVDQGKNYFLGQHGINPFVFVSMSKSLPLRHGVSHRGVRMRA